MLAGLFISGMCAFAGRQHQATLSYNSQSTRVNPTFQHSTLILPNTGIPGVNSKPYSKLQSWLCSWERRGRTRHPSTQERCRVGQTDQLLELRYLQGVSDVPSMRENQWLWRRYPDNLGVAVTVADSRGSSHGCYGRYHLLQLVHQKYCHKCWCRPQGHQLNLQQLCLRLMSKGSYLSGIGLNPWSSDPWLT